MKTIIKKTLTILSGISLIGSTLMGACALSYPQPFVNQGLFYGNLVVGQNAQSSDILGSVDIMTSLQYSMKRNVNNVNSGNTQTVDNGYKIEKSGNNFNYGDSIAGVLDGSEIGNTELPAIFSDGKLVDNEGSTSNDITYTQSLEFFNTDTGNLVYTQINNDAPEAKDYLHISRNKELYKYTLSFDTPLKYDNSDIEHASDDLKTNVINIEGRPYTISDVSLDHGKLYSISLLSGESVLWLTQDQPIEKTLDGVQHNIEVKDVTDQADACQVTVDGTTDLIDKGTQQTINGIDVGVVDVRAMHSQLQDNDVCEITVGSSNIILENNEYVKVNGEEVEGAKVTLDDNGGSLNSISIDYTPKNLEDNLYLKSGQSFIDPIFGMWKIYYGGINNQGSTGKESYSIKVTDEDGNVDFTNNEGHNIELPIYKMSDGNVTLGSGPNPDEQIYMDGNGINYTNNVCKGQTSVEDCEGMQILADTTDGEVHLFEVDSIDNYKNTTSIRDVTNGRTFNDIKYKDSVDSDLNLGSFGHITLNIDNSTKTIEVINSIPSKINLNSGGSLGIDNSDSKNLKVSFNEINSKGISIGSEENPSIAILSIKKGSDGDLEINSGDWTHQTSNVQSEEDSDTYIKTSDIGSQITYNTNDNDVTITMPKDETFGNVYITPIDSEIMNYIGGQSYTIQKLTPGSAKLDSEIYDVSSQNLISVGGPCANSVTAKIMGLNYPSCGVDSTIQPNTAIIKSFAEQNGNVALVIAGWESDDTRRASRVLANYDQYNINLAPGNEYTVTGNGLSDISVTKTL